MTLDELLAKSRGCDYDVYGIKKNEVSNYLNCEVKNLGVENNTLLIIIDPTKDSGFKSVRFWRKFNFREGFKEEKKQVLTYLKNRREFHKKSGNDTKELDTIISYIEKVGINGVVK